MDGLSDRKGEDYPMSYRFPYGEVTTDFTDVERHKRQQMREWKRRLGRCTTSHSSSVSVRLTEQ